MNTREFAEAMTFELQKASRYATRWGSCNHSDGAPKNRPFMVVLKHGGCKVDTVYFTYTLESGCSAVNDHTAKKEAGQYTCDASWYPNSNPLPGE